MKIGGVLIGGVCAIAASLISAHAFFDPEPEAVTRVSEDGVFALEGVLYHTQDIVLATEQGSLLSPFFENNAYRLSPEETYFSSPLRVTLPDASSYDALYRFDAQGAYWAVVPEDEMTQYIHDFTISWGGLYVPGVKIAVEIPTFIDVLDGLHERLPQNTVSYRIKLIATPEGGAPLLISSSLEQGACGGIPTHGRETLVAEDSRTVQVLVNDVLTSTMFTFFMEIETAPEGCAEDMPMEVIL